MQVYVVRAEINGLHGIFRIFSTMELAVRFELFLKELLWTPTITAVEVETEWEEGKR